jgi:hypothetical protein
VAASPGIAGKPDDAETSRPRRKRRSRRGSTAGRSGERSSEFSGLAVAVVALLVVWGALAGLAFVTQTAAVWLAVCGALTTLAAVAWLYQVAAEEGVERLSFLNVEARGLILGVLFLLIELIVMPVFCVVIVVSYFGSAWRPALVALLGGGMCATGVLLLLR